MEARSKYSDERNLYQITLETVSIILQLIELLCSVCKYLRLVKLLVEHVSSFVPILLIFV